MAVFYKFVPFLNARKGRFLLNTCAHGHMPKMERRKWKLFIKNVSFQKGKNGRKARKAIFLLKCFIPSLHEGMEWGGWATFYKILSFLAPKPAAQHCECWYVSFNWSRACPLPYQGQLKCQLYHLTDQSLPEMGLAWLPGFWGVVTFNHLCGGGNLGQC
jgi:hypothetical protein